MIKAIIIDDEPLAGQVIETLVSSLAPEIKICSICLDIEDAVKNIYKHQPEIVFLDIELADGSGFEILEKFSELRARIIFVTAYEQYALKAIKYNAFDYILKPVAQSEIKKVLDKVLKDIQKSTSYPDNIALLNFLKGRISPKISVPARNGLQYYAIDEIVLFEAEGSYTNLYLTNGKKVMVSRIIKDFETSLAGNVFLRVHKSFMVNINHIAELRREDSGYLVMSNGSRVPISTRDRDEILYRLKAHIHNI